MGKIKILKCSPLTSIQDFGRFGYRKFGVPQSGSMDRDFMIAANQLVGNSVDFPVIEFAMSGIEFEVLEKTTISVIGAKLSVNKSPSEPVREVNEGDYVKVFVPKHVYAYVAISGKMDVQQDFGSFSTYERAGFGGIAGRNIHKGDELSTKGSTKIFKQAPVPIWNDSEIIGIRIMKGPEWSLLKELPSGKTFQIDSSSDRMGIRLTNEKFASDYQEIASSAVIPGTIQLPSDGHPIVLMNDCQTTGGYPRIGKVIKEDLGKLAQIRPGKELQFVLKEH